MIFSLKSEINKFTEQKTKEWVQEIIYSLSLIVEGFNSNLFLLKNHEVENGFLVGTGVRQKPVVLVKILYRDGNTPQSPVILNVVSPILGEPEEELCLSQQANMLRLIIKRAFTTHVDD